MVKRPFNGFQWNKPKVNDNIELIFEHYKNLNLTTESLKKNYYLLKIEDIFEKMVDIYINKENFNEYLLLKNFIDFDEKKKFHKKF